MPNRTFIPVPFTSFNDRRASAEEVAVVETATGNSEVVDAGAFVALPEPVEGYRGRREELGGYCGAEAGGCIDWRTRGC